MLRYELYLHIVCLPGNFHHRIMPQEPFYDNHAHSERYATSSTQYTATLHAVIYTLQQNHYPDLNRVSEHSIQSILTNNPSRVTLLPEFIVISNMAKSSIRHLINKNIFQGLSRP